MRRSPSRSGLPVVLAGALLVGFPGQGWPGSDRQQEGNDRTEQSSSSSGESGSKAKDLIQSIRKTAKPIEQELSRSAAKAAELLTGKSREQQKQRR